jgi:hypothetical protein
MIVTAAQLLALASDKSHKVNTGQFHSESGGNDLVDIYQIPGALFFQSSMAVDCDGLLTAECNRTTDPGMETQTSATDSHGRFLDAAGLPYYVLPSPGPGFDYNAHGISYGQVAAIVYNGQVGYAVFGDEDPTAHLGEASCGTAKMVGVNPNPTTGGTPSGVTYIVFTGPGAVADPIEDHAAATALGETLATALVSGTAPPPPPPPPPPDHHHWHHHQGHGR